MNVKREIKCPFLLPVKARLFGYALTALGITLLMIRFYYGIKPEIFNLKVFAIYSAYIDVKYMTVIKNQMAEEIGGILAITGLFMIAFSRKKNEDGQVNAFRLSAFFISVYVNTGFLILAMAFTFGFGFMYMLLLNLILGLIIYIIAFETLLYRNNRRSVSREINGSQWFGK